MERGTVAELGHPHQLLQDDKGIFYSIVKQHGPELASSMTQRAAAHFRQKYSNRKISTYSQMSEHPSDYEEEPPTYDSIEIAPSIVHQRQRGVKSKLLEVIAPNKANLSIPSNAEEDDNDSKVNDNVANGDIANGGIANGDIANGVVANRNMANGDNANGNIANEVIANRDIDNHDIAYSNIDHDDIANDDFSDGAIFKDNGGHLNLAFDGDYDINQSSDGQCSHEHSDISQCSKEINEKNKRDSNIGNGHVNKAFDEDDVTRAAFPQESDA